MLARTGGRPGATASSRPQELAMRYEAIDWPFG
jgi:hypothetical protein